MPRPRKELVCLTDTPYYHVISRYLRRTFLCGTDSATGKSYERRRQWIEDRVRLLSSIFTIDIYSYAIMSNHFHISFKDYIELVDATGRIAHQNKKGSIPESLPPILKRITIDHKEKLQNTKQFEERYYQHFERKQTPNNSP